MENRIKVSAGLVMAGLLGMAAANWLGARPESAPVSKTEFASLGSSKASPGVMFATVALGGFRGIIADILWMRVSRLQDEGRFFELVQLADWITGLEPRYPEVWAYHAWNMAYNVSVMFPNPLDRWRWVENGVRLLRDEGIPANPREPQLYWELGWLYADKIGGPWDDAELFYKVALASEMTRLLGGGFPDYAAIRGNAAWREHLQEQGLIPDAMEEIDRTLGPFDWRLPATHAIYWAHRARGVSGYVAWCERLVYQELSEIVRNGSLRFDPARQVYLRGPSPDAAMVGIRQLMRHPPTRTPLVDAAVENFLRESVTYLEAYERHADAAQAWRLLSGRLAEDAKGVTLDAFLRNDVGERLQGVPAAGRSALVEGILIRGLAWQAAGDAACARALERVARLHWEVMRYAKVGPGAPPADWATLTAHARERAGKELPESLRLGRM